MPALIFISHPEVVVDASQPVTSWGLSAWGRERAERFALSQTVSNITAIWSSAETKALETAAILAERLQVPVKQDAQLGENDRSATGFLPPADFEAAADQFFAKPEVSFRGWETAAEAQRRILSATRRIVARHRGGDLALVSHGAVGTLLYCGLSQLPISRAYDQPGQGHYWSADLATLTPRHGWRSMG